MGKHNMVDFINMFGKFENVYARDQVNMLAI